VHLPSEAAVTASSGEGDVRVTEMGRAVSAHSDLVTDAPTDS
jgi:hypothetical protein